MSDARSIPADGYGATWVASDDREQTGGGDDRCGPAGAPAIESVRIEWDNEAWTATGTMHDSRVQYVMRISPFWELRQLLLFRDLDEPDLWLGTDGRGRWGEVNGAHRPDLDGARDAMVAGSHFGWTPPIRRMPLPAGEEMTLPILVVDAETLAVTTRQVALRHDAVGRWEIDGTNVTVDDFGLILDVPGRVRREP